MLVLTGEGCHHASADVAEQPTRPQWEGEYYDKWLNIFGAKIYRLELIAQRAKPALAAISGSLSVIFIRTGKNSMGAVAIAPLA